MPKIVKSVSRPWMPKREVQSGRVRPNSKFYTSSAWRRVRAIKIQENPLCEECQRRGVLTPADVVDHITPINQGGEPFDESNLQSLCHRCHNKKSGREAHSRCERR